MINLDKIAEELFNKIRGRYPKVTLGDDSSTITNMPNKARFFDFEYTPGNKVNVTIDEKSLTILYNNELLSDDNSSKKEEWYGFMKELRTFAKKRMLNFDTRDITKTNLDRRDYEYMSKNRPGEETMSESKMYGTSKTSYQDVGDARLVVKHRGPVNQELPAGRTQQIDSIYIESSQGERFKYPFRHLNGARAMARHVSEGGNAYDTFGKHIVSLSEELSKLRQFKTYMNRSNVMAEGLAGYMDIVNERIDTVKETVFKLQRQANYKEAFESFEETVMEEVPSDVSANWIDELTIRQFNEELKGVFPYIYKLVGEATKAKELGPDDLLANEDLKKDMAHMKDLVKGILKDPLNGDKVAKKINKKYGRDLTGKDIEEGQFDSMSREELLKAKDEAEASIKNMQSSGNDPQAKFYDETQMMMAQQYLDSINDALEKMGEDEDLNMEDNFTSHLDSIVANSKHEQGPMEASTDVEDFMTKIATSDDGYDMMDAGLRGKHGPEIQKELQSMYDDTAVDIGAHPDDDFEKIHDRMMDNIEADYGTNEGNEFAEKVRALKAKGAKPGTKFKTSDGEEHTLEDAINKVGMNVEDFWTAEELVSEDELPKSPKVLKLVIDDLEKFKAEQDEAKKQGYDEDVRMMQSRIDDMLDIANLIKDGGPIAALDTSVQDTIVDYYEKAGEPLPFAKEADDDTMDVKIDKDGALSKADAPDDLHDKEKEELPLDEFIKGHFDYTTNQFPKGETAVMTAVEKKYGDDAVTPATEIMQELVNGQDEEMSRIKTLAGLEN